MHKILFVLIFLCFSFQGVYSQQPKKPTASEIYNSIQKLNFLGSVLYIAAHPDDENTKLITHLANSQKAYVTYLSITRGDGGQNLIGPELRDLLGVIRTHELLEARKIDGGNQLFTRAVDFGFSKNPNETLQIWNRDEVLSDVILAIRKTQPDIIINRFDHRTPGTTHGHHTASAILSFEAFDKSNDKNVFPENLGHTAPWQAKRLFMNTSRWFYGSQESFDNADKTNMFSLETGTFYPSLGLSDSEIAALSRSRHQSQGFGNTGSRGTETEYLEFLKGDFPKGASNIFEGIDTTWSRIEGGKAIGDILYQVEKDFDFKNPAASVPDLIKAYVLLKNRTDFWGIRKTEEIKELIAACSGLFAEAVASTQNATKNEEITLHLEAINRSDASITLNQIQFQGKPLLQSTATLAKNQKFISSEKVILSENTPYTSPYWLENNHDLGLYEITDKHRIGLPEIEIPFPVEFACTIFGEKISFTRNLVYKFNSPVTGEVYQPFQVLPEITGKFEEKVILFPNNNTQEIQVTLQSGKDTLSGQVSLIHPKGWTVSSSQSFHFTKKGESESFRFLVIPPKHQEEGILKLHVEVEGKMFDKQVISIDYSHIPHQRIVSPAEVKIARIELDKKGENIGYIAGAGDEIPKALVQIGYHVTRINPETFTQQSIQHFDAIVMGIRAYNTVESLAFKQPVLFQYVKNGGNLILQYNVSSGLVTHELTPFSIELSRNRVTDENSPVAFINPNHSVMQYPNSITQKDFEGWIQERGLYFPATWDKAFVPVLKMNDPDETPTEGSLLVASYGKGHVIYTGLSFFRQLPEGVPGAYRLFANMLSLGKK